MNMQPANLLEQHLVSIIIPTYNSRHYYLKRSLNYHVHHNIEILIADSSPKPFPETEYRNFSHVQYYHYPLASYTEKINNILEKITTPYTLLLADDDFITLHGIKLCIEFLQKNKDYASAQGNKLCFRITRNNVKKKPYIYHLPGLNIGHNNSLERIKFIFDQSISIYYSVHRTETIKQTFFLTHSFKDDFLVGMIESFLDIIAIITGKHKMLPCFYSAIEISTQNAGHIYLSPPSLKQSKIYKEQYENCLQILSSYLSRRENIALPQARQVIDYAFQDSPVFVSKYSISEKVAYPLRNLHSIKKIIDVMPFSLSLKIFYAKMLYKLLHYRWEKKLIVSFKKEIRNSDTFPFPDANAFQEWVKIKSIIRQSRRLCGKSDEHKRKS